MRPLSPTTTPITLTTTVCRQLLRSRCKYRTAKSSSLIRSATSHQFPVFSLAPFRVVSFLARQFKFTERTEAIPHQLLLSHSVLHLQRPFNAASRPHALIPQLFPGFDFSLRLEFFSVKHLGCFTLLGYLIKSCRNKKSVLAEDDPSLHPFWSFGHQLFPLTFNFLDIFPIWTRGSYPIVQLSDCVASYRISHRYASAPTCLRRVGQDGSFLFYCFNIATYRTVDCLGLNFFS